MTGERTMVEWVGVHTASVSVEQKSVRHTGGQHAPASDADEVSGDRDRLPLDASRGR